MYKPKSPFNKDQTDKNKHKAAEMKPTIPETFRNSPIYFNKTLNTKKNKQNFVDYNYSKKKCGNFDHQGQINLECDEVLISPSTREQNLICNQSLEYGGSHQNDQEQFDGKYDILWSRMKRVLDSYQQRQYEMKNQIIRLTERNQYLESGRIMRNI